jgi:hypothetical protein
MMRGHRPPAYDSETFTCPHCGVLGVHAFDRNVDNVQNNVVGRALCRNPECLKVTLWLHGKLVYPVGGGPEPHVEMPGEIKETFEEARSISGLSPRAAAALLRLAVEQLSKHVAAAEPDVDADASLNELIGEFVAKLGLHRQTQRALDVVRVIGNNAVHPGQIAVHDRPETVAQLFALVNFIVDDLISKPRALEEMYSDLPEGAREQVERRDGSAATNDG